MFSPWLSRKNTNWILACYQNLLPLLSKEITPPFKVDANPITSKIPQNQGHLSNASILVTQITVNTSINPRRLLTMSPLTFLHQQLTMMQFFFSSLSKEQVQSLLALLHNVRPTAMPIHPTWPAQITYQ